MTWKFNLQLDQSFKMLQNLLGQVSGMDWEKFNNFGSFRKTNTLINTQKIKKVSEKSRHSMTDSAMTEKYAQVFDGHNSNTCPDSMNLNSLLCLENSLLTVESLTL